MYTYVQPYFYCWKSRSFLFKNISTPVKKFVYFFFFKLCSKFLLYNIFLEVDVLQLFR